MDNLDNFDDKEIFDGEYRNKRSHKSYRRNRKTHTPKEDSEDDQEIAPTDHSSDALRSDEIGIRMERLLKE